MFNRLLLSWLTQTAVRSQVKLLRYPAADHVRFQAKNSSLGVVQQYMERLAEALIRCAHDYASSRIAGEGTASSCAASSCARGLVKGKKELRRVRASDVYGGIAADPVLSRVLAHVRGVKGAPGGAREAQASAAGRGGGGESADDVREGGSDARAAEGMSCHFLQPSVPVSHHFLQR